MQAICDAHVEALVLLDYVNNDVVVQRCEALMTLALHPLVNAISVFNAVLAVETRMASAQRKAGLLKKLLGLARVKQDVQLQCSIVTVAWQRLGEACSRKSAGLRYVCLEVLGELVKPVDAGGSGQLSRNDKTAGHMDSTAVTANDIRRLTLSFCDDTDARVRHTALNVASASYRRGVVMGIDVYQAAVHALDDASPEVRMQAINVVWVCANTSPDAKIDQGTETRMVDDAFAKICDLVNDVEVPVRERACQLLGSIHGVQDEIVLQTLDKNIMSHLRHAKTHEQKRNEADGTINPHGDTEVKPSEMSIIESGACGALVHGIEDEFSSVRRAAIGAMLEISHKSARFGARCADYLVDMFNDEIDDVRLAAMHSLRLMISYTQFNSEHVDIMLGSLHEDNVLVRNAVLRLLGDMRFADVSGLRTVALALIDIIIKYPETHMPVWGAMQGLAHTHPVLTEFIAQELLGFSPDFAAVEPNVNDVAYIGVLILVMNAAAVNERIIPLCPTHCLGHLHYLMDKWPAFFSKVAYSPAIVSVLGKLHHSQETVNSPETPDMRAYNDGEPTHGSIIERCAAQMQQALRLLHQRKHEGAARLLSDNLSELQRVSSLYSEHSQPCTHARVYRTFTKIAFGFLKLRRLLPEARDVAQRDTQNSADAATPTYTHTYTHTPTHTHTSTHTPTHTHTSTHTPTHTHTSTHTPTHTPRDTSTARATETGPSAEGDSGVRNQSHRIAGAPQLSAEARAALPSLSLLMLHQVARVCHTYLGVRESMQCGLDEMRLVWCGVYLVCVMEAHVPKGGVAGDGIVGGDAGYGHTTQSRVRAHTDTPAHPRESTHTHMCDLWEIVVAQAREWCERYDPPQTHKTVQEQTRLTRVSVKRPRTDSSAQALPTAATHDDRHTGHAAKGTHTEETASGADASKGVMGFARDILRMNEEYVGHGHNGRHTHTHARTHDRSGASTDSREQLMLGEEIGNEGTVAHAQTRPLHRTHWHSLRQAMLSAIATYTPPHVELTGAVLRRVHATHTVHVKPRKGLSAAESAVAMPTPVHVHGVLYNVPNLFMSRIRLCCKLVNGSTHCTALKPCALSGRTMTRDLDGEVASAQQHNNTISVTHHTQHSTHTTQGTQSTRVSGSSSEHEVVAFRVTESFHPARQKGKAKIHLTITMKYKNGEGLQRFLDTVKDLTSASALRQESPESDSIARTSTYRDELKLLGLHECTITISKQRSFQT